jgi:hypothetical protein
MKIFKDMWTRVFKKGGREDAPAPTHAPPVPAAPAAQARAPLAVTAQVC